MKHYGVDVDITMSCRIEVDAESEDHAKTIVANWIGDDSWRYVKDGHYMSHEFEAVNECEPEEEKTELQKAIDYVRDNMDEDDMAILKAEVRQCYKAHLIPGENVMDCDRVIDLLEEYGDENDLPERWWESECEIDEILCEL